MLRLGGDNASGVSDVDVLELFLQIPFSLFPLLEHIDQLLHGPLHLLLRYGDAWSVAARRALLGRGGGLEGAEQGRGGAAGEGGGGRGGGDGDGCRGSSAAGGGRRDVDDAHGGAVASHSREGGVGGASR